MIFGSVSFISISSLWRDAVYDLGSKEWRLRGPVTTVGERSSSGAAVLASDYWFHHKLAA